MSDIKLVWDSTVGFATVGFAGNDLVMDAGHGTAVMVSLFTDARARDDDSLPDPFNTDPRGCWMDGTSERSGDTIGSRLWLLQRAKTVEETLRLAEEYAREALQWMLDEKVAVRVDVAASREENDMLGLKAVIYRTYNDSTTYEFQIPWEGTAAYGT